MYFILGLYLETLQICQDCLSTYIVDSSMPPLPNDLTTARALSQFRVYAKVDMHLSIAMHCYEKLVIART